jgi:hypothetical protein
MIIESKKAVATRESMRPDQEVRENASGSRVALLTPPLRVRLECPTCRSPNRLIQIPINYNCRVFEEGIYKSLGPAWSSHQFSEHGSRHHEVSTIEGCL